MLNHVDLDCYVEGVRHLIKNKAVDLSTLSKLRGFRPKAGSAAMREARLKDILSDATFGPPLSLYIGREPALPEQPQPEPFGKFDSLTKARKAMEEHFAVGEGDHALVQIKLLWIPEIALYCWREKRLTLRPASSTSTEVSSTSRTPH